MSTDICFNFAKKVGVIKPMHGVGQPPIIGLDTQYFKYLKEANIPYSRLHDVGGWFGGNLFVDIPNIFRNFDADVNTPESYDFVFTDILLKGLIENDCQPVFRLGVTIENFCYLKSFRINPPSDPEKWAEICEHIVAHYNEGWANGFHYGIEYWEVWNEPDNGIDYRSNMMWTGNKEQYYNLYRCTALRLKARFKDSIKIGGYAGSGFYAELHERTKAGAIAMGLTKEPSDWEKRMSYFVDFFKGFLDMVKSEYLPLDFFSHHSYGGVKDTTIMQDYVEKTLDEYGLGKIEIHLNEWNTNAKINERGTELACANATSMMIKMQNKRMAMMNFYDARIGQSVYGGLFNPLTYKPLLPYYGFQAFGKLYVLKNQCSCECEKDGVYALCATDGKKKGAVISNIGEEEKITTNFVGGTVYLIDEDHYFVKSELNAEKFTLGKNHVVYIEG